MAETRGLKSLENWAKRVTNGYSGVNVTNMSSSFRDGLAFCAIIHHYYPGLIDFESLSKENILYNNSLAFSTAEKQLGVPALLDAEDMVNYAVPDRLSIITYLSQLHNCFENQNRVNRVRPCVKHALKEAQGGPPSKLPFGELKNSTPRTHELCQVCKHRVFILERQIISGKLYHRTCFRCSRCDSLLKPGAYVESDESAGTYECVICPRDEKKDQDAKLSVENTLQAGHTETDANGTPSSAQSSPSLSPLATPRLPMLSLNLNIARNNFLRKGVDDTPVSESDHDVCSNRSSSDESIPTSLDRESTDSHEPSLDNSSTTESTPKDVTNEKSMTPVRPARQGGLRKSLSPILPPNLNGESDSPSVHKPYQSVFSREILHTISLTPPAARSPLTPTFTSGTELKKTSPLQLSSDIPFVRSTSYSATSLPRHKTSFNMASAESPNFKLKTYKAFSNSNLTDEKVDEVERIPRKGSLGEMPQDKYEISSDKKSSLKLSLDRQKSDAHVVERASPDANRVSNASNAIEVQSPTSVKQLIRLREASIRDSKVLPSAFKRESKVILDETKFSSVNDTLPEKPSDSKTSDQVPDAKPPELSISEAPVTPVEVSQPPLKAEAMDITISNTVSKSSDNTYAEEVSQPPLKASIEAMDITISDPMSKSSDNTNADEVSQPPIKASIEAMDVAISDPVSKSSDNTNAEAVKSSLPIESRVEEPEIKTNSVDAPKPSPVAISVSKDLNKQYPDDLNPFGDDDEDVPEKPSKTVYPDSLNPFGDSDDEGVAAPVSIIRSSNYDESKNPFASDDDDDDGIAHHPSATICSTPSRPPVPPPPKNIVSGSRTCQQSPHSITTESPTGSIKGTLKKRKAPTAPHVKELFLNSSANSETSVSSFPTSPSPSRMSPSPRILKHKRAPPPPPASPALSNKSEDVATGTCDKDMDSEGFKFSPKTTAKDSLDNVYKKKKRPAPPVPIPRRREVKKIPLKDIKSEMNEIEEKQMDLEKQGRELEVLIRDRDKDEEPTVEEEEYIMQLFELVNEKNALFRRQAELMYIKRSQRLEEEQVELEFQVRCLMIKPASKKTDEDKVLEENLVQQLLDVIDQRNEIVDSIERDRLREASEDVSVQEQMEIKNSDLPITAEIKAKSEKKAHKHKEKKKKKKKKSKEAKEDETVTSEKKTGTLKKKWF